MIARFDKPENGVDRCALICIVQPQNLPFAFVSRKMTSAQSRREDAARAGRAPRGLRRGPKIDDVVKMLSRPDGATIDAIVTATGWLPHTTRAALTGLRKRGYAIERSRSGEGGSSVYRLTRPSQPGV
jgi:Protein of unknown function (DUF3489)